MPDSHTMPKVSAELDRNMVLVHVSVSAWSGVKTDSEVTGDFVAEKKAERDAGAFRKQLINAEELKLINREANRARQLVYQNAMPWIGGTFILPVAGVAELKAKLDDAEAAFNASVMAFLGKYAQLRDEAGKRLGDLYSADDYPDQAEMAEKFALRAVWQPVGATHVDQMNLVDDVAKVIAASAAQAQTDAAKAAKRELGERVRTAVLNLATTLESYETRLGDDDSKKPVLKSARIDALDHLHDLVAHSDFDGSGDNIELAEMIEVLRSEGVEALREKEESRKRVMDQCAAIKRRMEFWT